MKGGGNAVETFSIQPPLGCNDAIEIAQLYMDFLEVSTPPDEVAERLAYNIAGAVVGADVMEKVAVKVGLRLY
jgi:hypothetical protein